MAMVKRGQLCFVEPLDHSENSGVDETEREIAVTIE
jgi:hypothetical protein